MNHMMVFLSAIIILCYHNQNYSGRIEIRRSLEFTALILYMIKKSFEFADLFSKLELEHRYFICLIIFSKRNVFI